MNANLFLITAICGLAAGCIKPPVMTPSPKFNAFSLTQALSPAGFQAQDLPGGERTTNSATGRAQIIQHGLITSPATEYPAFQLFQAIKSYIETGGNSSRVEGWWPQAPEHPGGPVRITIFQNQAGRHSEMHLWLFPNTDESQIQY